MHAVDVTMSGQRPLSYATVTSYTTVTSLVLVSCLCHTLAEFSCNQPDKNTVTRWHEMTSYAIIDWRIDRVCSTYTECFGYQPNGDVEQHVQLCPVQVQVGDQLFIRPAPSGSPYSTKPVNVTLDEWIYCPNRDYPAKQQIFSSVNSSQLIPVSPHFLRPGVVYIAEAPNGVFSNCRYGLRVAVTVKPRNCVTEDRLVDRLVDTFDNLSVLCSDHGVCGVTLLQSTYRCLCDKSYRGNYCGEYDACIGDPCQNKATCHDVNEGVVGQNYTCNCADGFTGKTCDKLEGLCTNNTCGEDGRCFQVTDTTYRCHCSPAFTGHHCEVLIEPCSYAPCKHNSTCLTSGINFTCLCSAGFTGELCETSINACALRPCAEGATCVSGVAGFTCVCVQGYKGSVCNITINYCESNPCLNGGACEPHIGGYKCNCTKGFYGDACQLLVGSCAEVPHLCEHGGLCVQSPDGTDRCQCSPGWTGVACQLLDNLCIYDPCPNGTICIDLSTADRPARYKCTCPGGFTGYGCREEIDECASEPCQNGATCSDLPEAYNCSCSLGFQGSQCEIDVDACEMFGNDTVCLNGATCLDSEVELEFSCLCVAGFTGDNCSVDINECVSGPCQHNGTCVDTVDGYHCVCSGGHSGPNCDVPPCLSEECGNGGSCEVIPGGTRCVCTPAWTGNNCMTALDVCLSNPCFSSATCEIGTGMYRCVCSAGFTGLSCETNIDDCISNPCGHGTCLDDLNSFSCHCPSDGRLYDDLCQPVDPCLSSPCHSNGTCVGDTSHGTFLCQCGYAYEGDLCQQEVNECTLRNVTCLNGGVCVDLLGNFMCACPPGHAGRFCGNDTVDGCVNGNLCQNNATCVDSVDGYTCHCTPGHTGPRCNDTVASCLDSPCVGNTTCLDRYNPASGANFTCSCPPGYTGVFCDNDVDECQSIPCHNAASCVNGLSHFQCQCQAGFTGVTCDSDINECLSVPCVNGGSCIDGKSSFTCLCSKDYKGPTCQVKRGPCDSGPCQNGGYCRETGGSYECFCPNGFTGSRCEENYDECLSRPCLHDGRCTDLVAGFNCSCLPGSIGVLCETDIDECASSPCLNDATCVDSSDTYICECAPGFNGSVCGLDIDECVSTPCHNGGLCRNNFASFICDCPKPYQGVNCALLPCEVNPCGPGGSNCTNDLLYLPLGFRCQCVEGYTGYRCQENIDDCLQPDGQMPCSGHGLCIDALNSYSCLCEPGWKGAQCDHPIDECPFHQCQNNATCVNTNEGYDCLCAPGYTGAFCGALVDECTLLGACLNGARCVDLFNDYRCICSPGWTGRNCSSEVNECMTSELNQCLNGATCIDGFLKITCLCAPFYTGTFCETLFDPCDRTYKPCENGATCRSTEDGGYNCSCTAGYEGPHCEVDIDECLSSPCQHAARCKDLPAAAYRCHCLPGYAGVDCEVDVDNCAGDVCQNNATCLDLVNGYLCNCTAGFAGVNCSDDIDECLSSPCAGGATCVNGVSSFSCLCPAGYKGVLCETELDECRSQPCQNNAICRDDIASYICYCRHGYTGVNCHIDIDECLSSPCRQGSCSQDVNSYTCSCHPGWTGVQCSVNINECQSSPCPLGVACEDVVDGYLCQCPEGFTGAHCESDIDICQGGNPSLCLNGGTCHDDLGLNFTCSCLQGYTGPLCEINIDECSSHPCSNQHGHVTCNDQPNGFNCTCPSGVTGVLCETDIDECQSRPCQHAGHCLQQRPPGFECLCRSGYGGVVCEVNYDDCLPAPKCLHSGQCLDGVDNYTCNCPIWTTGRNCETMLYTPTSSPTSGHLSTVLSWQQPTIIPTAMISAETMVAVSRVTMVTSTEMSSILLSTAPSTRTNVISTGMEVTVSPSTSVQLPTVTAAVSTSLDVSSVVRDVISPSQTVNTQVTEVIVSPSHPSVTVSPPVVATQTTLPTNSVLPTSVLFSSFSATIYDSTESAVQSASMTTATMATASMTTATMAATTVATATIATASMATATVAAATMTTETMAAVTITTTGSTLTLLSHPPVLPSAPTVLGTSAIETPVVGSSGVPEITSSLPRSNAADILTTGLSVDGTPTILHSMTTSLSPMATTLHSMTISLSPTATPRYNTSEWMPHMTASTGESVLTLDMSSQSSQLMSSWMVNWPKSQSSLTAQSVAMETAMPTSSIPNVLSSIAMPTSSMPVLQSQTDSWTVQLPLATPMLSIATEMFITLASHSPSVHFASVTEPNTLAVWSSEHIEATTTTLGYTTTVAMTTHVTVTTVAEPQSCIDEPCAHGGSCVNATQSEHAAFHCVCTFNYEGELCETAVEFEMIQFTDDSFLTFPAPLLAERDVLELSLKTTQEDGVVFYSAKDYSTSDLTHYVRLLVEGGVLKYEFSCIIQSFSLNSALKVDTGDVFNITVVQTAGCQATLLVVGPNNTSSRTQMGMLYVFPTFRLTLLSYIYFGGVPSDTPYIPRRGNNFTGCIGRLSWNTQPLQLHNATSWVNIGECGSTPLTTLPSTTPTMAPLTCNDLSCDNGATCRMMEAPSGGAAMYRCDCPLHFHGERCQEEISVYFPRFHGNSYLEHDLRDLDTAMTIDLYMSFKTTSNNGTLLFSDSEYSGFLYLFIKDGMMQFQLSCSQVNILFIDTQTSVNSGVLTTVNIHLSTHTAPQHCDVSIQINDNVPINASLYTSHQVAAPTLSTLYVGGLPPQYVPLAAAMRSEHIHGLVGCVRHLQVNDDERLVFQDATRGQNIDDCDIPVCSFHPCLNNGTCQRDGVSWFCVCPAGFTGSLCERSLCHLNPCQHGGTCIHQVTQGTYVCVCPYGRHGADCSQELTVTRPSFYGNQYGYSSYMAYPRVKNLDFHLELRFSFIISGNDRAPSGMMIYSGQRGGQPSDGADYIAVGLTEGHVTFQYDLGSGMTMIQSDHPVDAQTTVHSVHLGRYRQHGWLQVDRQRNVSDQSPGQLFGLNVFSEFYIGGHDTFDLDLLPNDLNFTSGFTGCIFDVKVRAGRYSRWSPLGKVQSGRNIQQCQRSECEVHSCYNGATCVDMGASYRCDCQVGWMGQLCADRTTPCDSPLTNLCAPGSRCSPQSEGGYKCQCALGKAGINCDQDITISDASFQGEASYMALEPPRNIHYSVTIAIEVKPTVVSGLILYLAEHLSSRTSDFLSVSLHHGQLQLRYNTGSDQPTIVPSSEPLDINTDKWHHVLVGRNRTHGYVQVEGRRVTAQAEAGMVSLDTTSLLYVGGMPDLSSVAPTAVEAEPATFEGCLRGLVIDGRQYALSETGAVEGLDVTDCDGTVCGLATCHNNGICQPEGSTYTCSCTEMFFGDTCRVSVYCRDHQCASGATCVPDMALGSYSCACPVGMKGRHCEADVAFAAARFTGEGFLHYTDTAQHNLSTTYISFQLLTRQRDGLILWNGQVLSQKDDFLAIGLKNGHLKVVVSLGWWTQGDLITRDVVSDGQWHSIIFQRLDQDLSVDINGQVTKVKLSGNHHHLDTLGQYHVGGFEEAVVKEQTSNHFDQAYIGCIRHLVVNKHSPPLSLLHPLGGANVFSCDDN